MASLKEVKSRIQSIKATRKITQARQMISSAKLRQMQTVLGNARKYSKGVEGILSGLITSEYVPTSPLCKKHDNGAVAVVIISSNNGMCGAFNSRLEKMVEELYTAYAQEELRFYPVGKKIREFLSKNRHFTGENLDHLADKATFSDISNIAYKLIQQYIAGDLKQVEVVFYNFRTTATQNLMRKTLLPYLATATSDYNDEYIFEPSLDKLINDLIPKSVCAELYAMHTSNQASEHAARTIAMQLATDNADDMLEDLQLKYNKLRQQNITSELLDIIGASFGQGSL